MFNKIFQFAAQNIEFSNGKDDLKKKKKKALIHFFYQMLDFSAKYFIFQKKQ